MFGLGEMPPEDSYGGPEFFLGYGEGSGEWRPTYNYQLIMPDGGFDTTIPVDAAQAGTTLAPLTTPATDATSAAAATNTNNAAASPGVVTTTTAAPAANNFLIPALLIGALIILSTR